MQYVFYGIWHYVATYLCTILNLHTVDNVYCDKNRKKKIVPCILANNSVY